MRVTVIGAGNSGIAMAAHLSMEGNQVTLWNRSKCSIQNLIETKTIKSEGVFAGKVTIHCVTDNMREALQDPDIILITTPASSHKQLAELIALNIESSSVIVLNPGRTFGAIEFFHTYKKFNQKYDQIVAETQTIIYTCRKLAEDAVNVIALKKDVLISPLNLPANENIIERLPTCIQKYFILADSMIQTSIGNVGMMLHCAPLLLNTGWTESEKVAYKYYYDGITPSIGRFIEKMDQERIKVSMALDYKVESVIEWLRRSYLVEGDSIYDCIQNNEVYKTIAAPTSLNHRYIFEDIPCGLVPLEATALQLGIKTDAITLVIDLASQLLDVDFRKTGRNLEDLNLLDYIKQGEFPVEEDFIEKK